MSTPEIAMLAAAFETPFGELGRSIESDHGSVVAGWPSVPVEVIRAAGFTPVFARGASTPTPAADEVLEPGVFPGRIHQLFEAALTGRLAHVAAIVLPRTSDADYKGYLYLRELARRGTPLPPVLLFDLLQSQGRDATQYNAARVGELYESLTNIADRRAAIETLRTQILRANAARTAAQRIAALRTGRPRVAGATAIPLLGACWQLQPERYCALAERAASALAAHAPITGPRVLLAGAPVDSPALHAAIESLHATVIDETGPFGNDVARGYVDASMEPTRALAGWYANNVATARCSGADLSRRVTAALAGIDVAVTLLPPSDARFGWDVSWMRKLFESRGVPHLALEVDPEGMLETDPQQRLCQLFDAAARRPVRHG